MIENNVSNTTRRSIALFFLQDMVYIKRMERCVLLCTLMWKRWRKQREKSWIFYFYERKLSIYWLIYC